MFFIDLSLIPLLWLHKWQKLNIIQRSMTCKFFGQSLNLDQHLFLHFLYGDHNVPEEMRQKRYISSIDLEH